MRPKNIDVWVNNCHSFEHLFCTAVMQMPMACSEAWVRENKQDTIQVGVTLVARI